MFSSSLFHCGQDFPRVPSWFLGCVFNLSSRFFAFGLAHQHHFHFLYNMQLQAGTRSCIEFEMVPGPSCDEIHEFPVMIEFTIKLHVVVDWICAHKLELNVW